MTASSSRQRPITSQKSFLNSEIIASFRPGAAANTAELPEPNALVKHFPTTAYRRKGRVFRGLPRIGRKSYGTEGVALLREFGVTEFGVYQFNQMKRDGQRNAFLLGNKNSVDVLTDQLDPVDYFYAPWISVEHLNVLEHALDANPTSVGSAIAVSTEGRPLLFLLESAVLRGTERDDVELFDLGTEIYKAGPFKKLRAWDKYTVFLFLCQLRSLNFVAKKRKLRLFFQQWHESSA